MSSGQTCGTGSSIENPGGIGSPTEQLSDHVQETDTDTSWYIDLPRPGSVVALEISQEDLDRKTRIPLCVWKVPKTVDGTTGEISDELSLEGNISRQERERLANGVTVIGFAINTQCADGGRQVGRGIVVRRDLLGRPDSFLLIPEGVWRDCSINSFQDEKIEEPHPPDLSSAHVEEIPPGR